MTILKANIFSTSYVPDTLLDELYIVDHLFKSLQWHQTYFHLKIQLLRGRESGNSICLELCPKKFQYSFLIAVECPVLPEPAPNLSLHENISITPVSRLGYSPNFRLESMTWFPLGEESLSNVWALRSSCAQLSATSQRTFPPPLPYPFWLVWSTLITWRDGL